MAASAFYSCAEGSVLNPHVLLVHSGSVRGASLPSQENSRSGGLGRVIYYLFKDKFVLSGFVKALSCLV
mgnify:CR=1 FL=1